MSCYFGRAAVGGSTHIYRYCAYLQMYMYTCTIHIMGVQTLEEALIAVFISICIHILYTVWACSHWKKRSCICLCVYIYIYDLCIYVYIYNTHYGCAAIGGSAAVGSTPLHSHQLPQGLCLPCHSFESAMSTCTRLNESYCTSYVILQTTSSVLSVMSTCTHLNESWFTRLVLSFIILCKNGRTLGFRFPLSFSLSFSLSLPPSISRSLSVCLHLTSVPSLYTLLHPHLWSFSLSLFLSIHPPSLSPPPPHTLLS